MQKFYHFLKEGNSTEGNTGILVQNRRCPYNAGVPCKGGGDSCKDILKHILAKS